MRKLWQIILLAGDVPLMYAALFLALAIRYGDFSPFPGPQTGQFVFHFSIIFSVWLVLLFAFDFYDISGIKKRVIFLKNLALFFTMAAGFGVVYFYLNVEALIVPKTILFLVVAIFSAFVFLWRSAFNSLLGSKRFAKKIAIVGWRPELDDLARDYLPPLNYEIAAVFASWSFTGFEKMKIFSDQKQFEKKIKEENVELAVFAAQSAAEKVFLRAALADVFLRPRIVSAESFCEEITGRISLGLIDEDWILNNISRAGRKNYAAAKRIFDVIFSFCGIILTVLIFPLVLAAVKIDSRGPVFFTQERKGKGGKVFKLYKFRTMTVTSDQHLVLRANDGRQITRAGRIIKRFHIDEFPQFYNILKGDLSFTGPRPEWTKLAADYEKEIPFYKCRYFAKPGFTGWAQINYKASVSIGEAREKFEYDLYYIKNQSFLLDLSIMLKTLQLFFR